MASKNFNDTIRGCKYELEQLLWVDVRYGNTSKRDEKISKAYNKYKKLGGKETLQKLRKRAFN